MKTKVLTFWTLVLSGVLLFAAADVAAQGGASLDSHKSVIGPQNHYLSDGAEALVNGYTKKGVELTEKGLKIAQGSFERKAALSNLCAGYLMINKPKQALEACNEVLEIDPEFWRAYNNRALVYLELARYEESQADIQRGKQLRPRSKNLTLTEAKLLDATNPVEPTVMIDERRSTAEDAVGGDGDDSL